MKVNNSLFLISQEIRSLIENNYDLEDISETEQKEIIETITNELKNKTDSVASYARKLKADIDNAKDELDRIKTILEQRKKKSEKYHDYVLMCMDIMQESSIEGKTDKIAIRKPSKIVTITDESLLPPQYITPNTTYKVDKATIKEMLKNGHEIAGAKLEDGKRSLRFL